MKFTSEEILKMNKFEFGFECLFAFQIILNFFTSYRSADSTNLETDLIKISETYFKGNFALDAFMIIPFS